MSPALQIITVVGAALTLVSRVVVETLVRPVIVQVISQTVLEVGCVISKAVVGVCYLVIVIRVAGGLHIL